MIVNDADPWMGATGPVPAIDIEKWPTADTSEGPALGPEQIEALARPWAGHPLSPEAAELMPLARAAGAEAVAALFEANHALQVARTERDRDYFAETTSDRWRDYLLGRVVTAENELDELNIRLRQGPWTPTD